MMTDTNFHQYEIYERTVKAGIEIKLLECNYYHRVINKYLRVVTAFWRISVCVSSYCHVSLVCCSSSIRILLPLWLLHHTMVVPIQVVPGLQPCVVSFLPLLLNESLSVW